MNLQTADQALSSVNASLRRATVGLDSVRRGQMPTATVRALAEQAQRDLSSFLKALPK